MPHDSGFAHDAGFVLECISKPGISAVVRVTAHGGLRIRPAGAGTLFIDTSVALVTCCAYYSAPIVANGWEPFDQPSATAYMPLSYSDFIRVAVASAGVVLVQNEPRKQLVRRPIVDDGLGRRCEFIGAANAARVAEQVCRWLEAVGVPRVCALSCAAELVRSIPTPPS